jgi:hypothetical protein
MISRQCARSARERVPGGHIAYTLINTMETQTKPLRGIEIVRRLLEVKKQTQREAKENYRNSPELQLIAKQLKEINGR